LGRCRRGPGDGERVDGRRGLHVSDEESGGSGSYVLTNEDDHETVTATHIGDK